MDRLRQIILPSIYQGMPLWRKLRLSGAPCKLRKDAYHNINTELSLSGFLFLATLNNLLGHQEGS